MVVLACGQVDLVCGPEDFLLTEVAWPLGFDFRKQWLWIETNSWIGGLL